MKNKIILLATCVVVMIVIATSCKKKEDNPTPSNPTLYERVGGKTMVDDPNNTGTKIQQGRLTLRAVVDSAIFVIAADNQLNPYFATLLGEVGNNNYTGFNELSQNLTDFLCVATGSHDYTYTGMSMHDAHDPAINNRMAMKADSTDFDQFVNDVGVALAQNGVTVTNNKSLVNDLVALLYTVEGDVVQR